MRFRRGIFISLLASLLCLGGCGTIGGKISRIVSTPEQERQLAAGLEYLREGNEKLARDTLEQVVLAPPLDGVTDEALFRLALLHLDNGSGKGATQSQVLLERLKNDYPRGLWTLQAAPLASYLSGVKHLRDKERELKNLRELNLSLNRENKELRKSIDRLKKLDLELEQKIRR